MSGKCKSCSKAIKTNQLKIECNECKYLFHGSCVNLKSEDIASYSGASEVWRCDPCTKKRRTSMKTDSLLSKSDPKLSDVIALLQEMRTENKEQIRLLESELGKSVDSCHDKIDELTISIEKQNETLKAFEEKYSVTLQENKALKKKVIDLETRIDDMEQYSRSNMLEINGIEEKEHENVMDIVKSVGQSLGCPITDEMVDACHRLGQKGQGRPRGIVVKFTRRSVKEDLLNKRRVKRNFNTKDIGISDRPADVIYINENLTQQRRKIFNAARTLKKENGFQFLWIRNGKVLLRTEEGANVTVLTSMDQVEALRKPTPATPAT